MGDQYFKDIELIRINENNQQNKKMKIAAVFTLTALFSTIEAGIYDGANAYNNGKCDSWKCNVACMKGWKQFGKCVDTILPWVGSVSKCYCIDKKADLAIQLHG